MKTQSTRRIAAALMHRGVSSIRIKPGAVEDAKKALTRDDVRALIKNGNVYAIAAKHNLSIYGDVLNAKRAKGRRRGQGRRKGSAKARGVVEYKQAIRGQRRVLKALKSDNTINNEMFKKLYALVKGGTFPSKVTLLNRIRSEGVNMDNERFEKLRHA